ncbi:MAG: type II secretion system secretin GspD [Myxococcota bacterium]
MRPLIFTLSSLLLVANSWARAQEPVEPENRRRSNQPKPPRLPLGVPPGGPQLVPQKAPIEVQRIPRSEDRLEELKARRKARLEAAAQRRAGSAQKKEEAAEKEAGTEDAVSRLRQQIEDESCVPMKGRRAFNFGPDDIQALVKLISEYTCKNFILTQKIRSQDFEILTNVPVSRTEIWRAFLSALEAQDVTVVKVGAYYKLIQATAAIRQNAELYGRDEAFPLDDQIITKIFRVRYGDVTNVVNKLNPFKSAPGGQIYPLENSGSVIITDYAPIVKKLERILEELDKPGALEQVHVVPVQYASASEVAEKLTQIFEPDTKTRAQPARRTNTSAKKQDKNEAPTPAAGGESAPAGPLSVSKILSDDRTNKLIIIASETALQQILALMSELDVPEDGTQGQIHVVRLRHADAEEISSTLASLAQGTGSQAQNQTPAQRRRAAANNANNQSRGSAGAALFQGEVRVTADTATNSLVITASKSDFASMQRVIAQLDVPRFQVFVEAVIMEVSTNNDRTLGVSWYGGAAPTINGEESPILFGSNPSQDLNALAATANPLTLASLLGAAGSIRGPTLDGTEDIIQGGIPALGAVINALQSENDVNVVSTPHLLTVDNEEAEIQVNEQRPFPSGLTLGGLGNLAGAAGAAGAAAGNLGGLGLGSVSFNREDIGLTLKLRPQINDEDYVRLEIEQELSDVAGIDQVTGQVITSNRSAQTVVVVRNQDSVVIGGLVRDRETRDESKVPLFGDIPLLGVLFKRQQKVVSKVNLILILTPYIIRGPDDFRKIFERKMEEREEFVNRFYGTSVDYRAAVDWDRKIGPLAAYRMQMRDEMRKAENDGPGLPSETIIRPAGEAITPLESLDSAPAETEDSDLGDGLESSEEPAVDEVPAPVPPPPLEEEAR